MTRTQFTAAVALGVVALFLVASTLWRMHEGRCRLRGGRFGLDCTYAAPAWPSPR